MLALFAFACCSAAAAASCPAERSWDLFADERYRARRNRHLVL